MFVRVCERALSVKESLTTQALQRVRKGVENVALSDSGNGERSFDLTC